MKTGNHDPMAPQIVECKRGTMLVLIAAFSSLTFAYYIQPYLFLNDNDTQMILKRLPTNWSSDDGFNRLKPLWTWFCSSDGHCERSHASKGMTSQSLATCNMVCSNTTLIWPLPTGPVKWVNKTIPVQSNDFSLTIVKSPSKEVSENLQEAFDLMKADLGALEWSDELNSKWKSNVEKSPSHFDKVIVRVTVTRDPDPRLRLDTNERYLLKLRRIGGISVADIRSQSFCGVRHGLETLSQLVWFDPYLGSLLMLQEATVHDAPVFRYRGLLLDTARHFFPVSDILRTLDAMAASKLNTFHWHATDSQSFPLKLSSVPKLAYYGAYGPNEFYTREDVRTVVQRAKLRGIRVVLEVDAPAHVTDSWAYESASSNGRMVFPCYYPPSSHQLNPLNADVYRVLEKIYAEILNLTEVTDVFHLGGDEVNENCWSHYMGVRSKPMALWVNFTLGAYGALVRANGGKAPKLTLLWSSKLTREDNFDAIDSKRFAIQVWGGSTWTETTDIPKAGYKTVASHVNAWYLDCGLGSWRGDAEGDCPYKTWQTVYDHRPWAKMAWLKPFYVGGEACQWTELLAPSGLDNSLWPRAAALAERLWTDPNSTARAKEYFRLDTHRNRLSARGIGSTPIWPRWCSENPYQCAVANISEEFTY